MTAEREALQRIRLVVDREDISCIGRIVVVKTLLDQALANPATIRDMDEDAGDAAWLRHLFPEGVAPRPLPIANGNLLSSGDATEW